ncbi:hypothetical protein QOL99_08645 [Deinococcus sp. MIMF12]|uniref:Uncharacterized protein n=1 Tax=Deinococcus rhizophilus TaxID=3049544 RepID=A0ABT7JGN4_9DEIO|nr:hypothetical protein [Deinococcus rhizophilus]MDL2344219.1 hypothetical protein [Deinococcus rhizophilus]
MGEAKRRRELGHMLRENTYTFTVASGSQLKYLGAAPVDEDDEWAVQKSVEIYGSDTDDWARAMASMFEDYGLDDPPTLPTHVRCELAVARIRNGERISYRCSFFPKELAYSLDGGQTWHDLSWGGSQNEPEPDASPEPAPSADPDPLAALQLDPQRPAFNASSLKTFERHGQPVTPAPGGLNAEEIIAQDREPR